MFTTDIIHFLQSFDSPALLAFMKFISALGLIPFLLLLILGITFGFDFRKGLVLLNLVAWTALLTNFAKEQIDYPRPPDLDSKIYSIYESKPSNNTDQSHGFFDLIPDDILADTRADEFERNGFPSGHTSTQVALWLGIIFLFNKRWTYYLGISIIILTMISRLYLGAHFLADVIGGLFLGFFCCILLLRYIKDSRFYTKRTHNFKSLSFLGFPLLLIPLIGHFSPVIIGSLIGINGAAILQIQLRNVPVNNGYALQRIATALIGVFIYLLAYYLPKILGLPQTGLIALAVYLIISFASFYGALAFCRKINLIRS